MLVSVPPCLHSLHRERKCRPQRGEILIYFQLWLKLHPLIIVVRVGEGEEVMDYWDWDGSCAYVSGGC